MSPLLEIAVPVPLRRTFHYLLPAGTEEVPAAGCRVMVPFGRKHLIGVLLRVIEQSDTPVEKLRQAIRFIDSEPILPSSLFTLCLRAADYYHHPVGDVLSSALPIGLRQGEPAVPELRMLRGDRPSLLETDLSRAPRQAELARLLLDNENGYSRDELNDLKIAPATIRNLITRSLADWHRISSNQDLFQLDQVNHPPVELTEEQRSAINSLGEATTLLQGVTGSGKTEVYLRAIEQMLQKGRQSLVLVPEIGLTPQTVARFSERFDVTITLYHSGLTDQERLHSWQQAAAGSAGIVIGTRSAVFLPLARPGLIVVDEEHDSSFKQQEGFKYSARDLAVLRGTLEQIPVVLGSATPSLETLQNAQTGRYTHLRLTRRPGSMAAEKYRVIGTQQKSLEEGFSEPLVEQIRTRISDGDQVLLFINRRGYAPIQLCPECNWMATCRHCDARLTCHLSRRLLICHHCAYETSIPTRCGQCESSNLLLLGQGTQRIEEHLSRIFPGTPVVRVDRDSTRRKGALAAQLAEIARGKPAILVGTQMLAKGHHFDRVTLSAILDIDASFFSTDYKAIERMGQLVLQVGGRSGRGSKSGEVIIQTHFPDNHLLTSLIHQGYDAFAAELLRERAQNNLPPFWYQALIRAESVNRRAAQQFLEEVAVAPSTTDAELWGPVPSSMEKRAGRYRSILLLTAPARPQLHAELNRRIRTAEQSRQNGKIRWAVDVDPSDLF